MQIPSTKSETKDIKIKVLEDAPFLYIPLSQHVGKSAKPIVQKGDQIKRFQKIGSADTYISANIHSPVSGVVKDICSYRDISGKETECIIIKNDYKNISEKSDTSRKIEEPNPSEILEIIKEYGIVGEGGAQFPTYVKYDIKDKAIDTFIVNGTECEPYLTSDYALMKKYTECLFSGINIVNKILKAKNIVLTIEEKNKDILEFFFNYINKKENEKIKIKILPDDYPQGGELQVIYSITGKELKKGSIPSAYGIIVSNAATVVSVYNAVVLQEPLTERIITVSGSNMKNCGNYLVKIGTPVRHILYTLGLPIENNPYTYVVGGPMMGKRVVNIDGPIVKGSSGILNFIINEKKTYHCISCGYCAEACPMNLQPYLYENLMRTNRFEQLSNTNIENCIECASCDYACPSAIPLLSLIKEEKAILKNRK